MSRLKDITYNCKQATFLIEKKQLQGITIAERFQLKYHLTGCSVCRLYQQQSEQISTLLKNHFLQFDDSQYTLSVDFKRKLSAMISSKIG